MLIMSVVIQPEFISDDFMVGLGFMKAEEVNILSAQEKIERKIASVESIKEVFISAVTLSLGGRRTT